MHYKHKIVGSWYRPPAKAILSILPLNTALIVRPEPTNPVDPNAIAVYVTTENIPCSTTVRKRLENLCADSGLTIDDVYDVTEHHLGYIPAKEAKDIKLTSDTQAKLAFDPKSNPTVSWEHVSN